MAATPNDFFTLQSLGTFAGATSATVFASNAIQYAFDINPRWLALALAEVICVGLVLVTQIDSGTQVLITPYFVAILNGFLVFCSAAGLTAVGAEARDRLRRPVRGPTKATTRTFEKVGVRPRREFLTPWF